MVVDEWGGVFAQAGFEDCAEFVRGVLQVSRGIASVEVRNVRRGGGRERENALHIDVMPCKSVHGSIELHRDEYERIADLRLCRCVFAP